MRHPGAVVACEQRSVIINYTVPYGSTFIPIMINECVTMIQVGSLNGAGIWEPINTFLQSPEDGLRYCRSMDVNDAFNGPLDVLPWGTPVQGAVSDDQQWMVDPQIIDEKTEEQPMPYHYNIGNQDSQLGEIPVVSNSQDIDLDLLSQLGTAVTRGAQDVSSRWNSGNPGHEAHAEQPAPSTIGGSPTPSIDTSSRLSPTSILAAETVDPSYSEAIPIKSCGNASPPIFSHGDATRVPLLATPGHPAGAGWCALPAASPVAEGEVGSVRPHAAATTAAALGSAWTRHGQDPQPEYHRTPQPHGYTVVQQPTLIERAAEVGLEAVVTTVVATAGAVAGAAAGEIVGGDIAATHIGSIAEPLGQAAGRNIGRIIGGTLGATAIRCSSRSASRTRTTSQVRFTEDRRPPSRPPSITTSRTPIATPQRAEHAEMLTSSMSTTQSHNLSSSQQSGDIDKEWLATMFGTMNSSIGAQIGNLNSNVQSQNLQISSFMAQTAEMFKSTNEETIKREADIKEQFQQALKVRDGESKTMARDQLAMSAQLQHLTNSVAKLREQVSAQADFAVDAIQQVRDEHAGDRADGAVHAGGERPEATSISSSSKTGRPTQSNSIPGPYSVECAYCDGEVPKVIAVKCQDCGAHFHRSHYAAHRTEWPCPENKDDWCTWCENYIQEHEAKVQCASCLCDLHTTCFQQHLPCPDGWIAKAPWPDEDQQTAVVDKVDVQSLVSR